MIRLFTLAIIRKMVLIVGFQGIEIVDYKYLALEQCHSVSQH